MYLLWWLCIYYSRPQIRKSCIEKVVICDMEKLKMGANFEF